MQTRHTSQKDTDPSNSIYYKPGLNIAHEVFEGELVVVNLETGRYYAMSGESADIFTLCTQVAALEEIVSALSVNYSGAIDDVKTASRAFLEQLKEEGLVTETDTRPDSQSSPSLGQAPVREFVPPTFEVHNDMQDLLMLDPIHEVDDAGWPVMKPQQD